MKKTNIVENIKKYLAIGAIVLLLVSRILPTAVVFADDTSPTPDPTVTIQNIDNSSNNTNTGSDTGNNTITDSPTPAPTDTDTPTPTDTTTPTPTDTDTPTPTDTTTPTPTIDPTDTTTPTPTDGTNDATVTDDVDSTGDSGDNTIATPSATPTPGSDADSDSSDNGSDGSGSNSSSGGNASINTGNAVSAATVDNNVNTTSVNSQVVYQTVNLFVTQDGDLNASDPFSIVSNVLQEHTDDPVINVAVTNVNNYSYLSNSVVSSANSGNNQIDVNAPAGSEVINTGDAYSLVSLLNKVNFTVINSTVHILTINVFGTLNGNIVLPNMTSSQNCDGCGVSTEVTNTAKVTDIVTSSADSGDNTITTASGDSSITTGDATSAVNTLNLVNSTLNGVSAEDLFVNVFGNWNGSFIGWDGFGPTDSASLSLSNITPNGTGSADPSQVNVSNSADVTNTISSTANTGGNSITGSNGHITTGNAYSAVSLINLINTSFFNSLGFFGFINIFGTLNGNIGGASEFAALTPTPSPDDTTVADDTSDDSSSDDSQEQGGLLSITQTNNTGPYVLPGDTVTFFMTVKNIGTGTVYGSQLELQLLKDGNPVGGADFNLGDIPAGKGLKISTGLVLSQDAEPGEYTARATVTGNVGPDNALISANADSVFTVADTQTVTTVATGVTPPPHIPHVLGATFPVKGTSSNDNTKALILLVAVVSAYVTMRLMRQKENVLLLFSKKVSLDSRLKTLKLLLL